MKLVKQELLRVILLDTRYRYIWAAESTKGSNNLSLAYPLAKARRSTTGNDEQEKRRFHL
jgi:hypothetical protein